MVVSKIDVFQKITSNFTYQIKKTQKIIAAIILLL